MDPPTEYEQEDEVIYSTRPHGDSTLGLIVNALFSVVSFIIAFIALPFLLPISLIFRLWRHHLDDQVMMETRGEALICSGDDALWLQDSPENKALINALFEVKGLVEIDKLRELVYTRFVTWKDEDGNLMFPKVSRYARWKNDRPVWMTEKFFDIKDHVYVWNKTKIPTNESELHELIGFLSSQALPEHQSRWQMIVIPFENGAVSDDEKCHFILFRVHHAIGDGVSLVKIIIKQLMDVSDDKGTQIVRFAVKNKAWRIAKAILTGPSILMERLYRRADVNILHGPKLSGDKLVAWSKGIDLDLIKKIKNASDTTVNDVLMASLAGAFMEYFKSHSSNVPSGILASVPVDLRNPNSKLVLDNQFAVVFLTLPTNIQDPIERLNETKQRMDFMKVSGEPMVNALSLRYCMERLPNWITSPLFDSITDKCTLVLSNVPGPQNKLFVAGNPIETGIFFPPGRSTVGITVSILSYCGRATMGVMVDRCLLTNPSILVDEFCKKLEELAVQLNVLEDSDKNIYLCNK